MTLDRRTTENQRRFRLANERIEEARVELAFVGDEIPFLCECPDPRCTAVIPLTPGEYHHVRDGDRFVLLRDHVPGGEEVVEDHERYVVTAKGDPP